MGSNNNRSRRKKNRRQDEDPIAKFFAQYPAFRYRPEKPIVAEFYRMCDYFEWDKQSYEKREASRKFKNAMVVKFNNTYGTDVHDINCWHKLCLAVDIDPIPYTIKECKKEISDIYVNLVDLVDNYSGRKAKLFDSLEDLREYTKKTGKFFPKESAYAGGVLKYLLREILTS
ncbi:hypothetical protein LOZ12_001707 [Ophidiomyces ophidiicola]|uniref:Uncharacterized protein n=1 Tax=Ophidiomyces ophidiicola TaxID=1387563 RepID=A0ACB8UWC1_9EURO|nr:uncharacterized protein LOZ57_005059 [Ophidiomyces ophidiicola]KAI1905671.1 hypothetical protein LOZ64_006726 [Ophidiomyces ophidiicola]KAI1911444.1 hypothetical protein LOZ61_003809 [Ophidiomyces ophidiicola]KAI1926264.1 hypothetical protein LOZ60_003639 [Ophidiomyces ophidiicola]KAI1943348.1 hypothetical protein LOZ57_005059 [Ophidiomyces ophidiicola]KAI1952991.1 hypothetical protein LOZ62_001259 [Ophidiomyces ophidiicola]